jgi:hypothetical protein
VPQRLDFRGRGGDNGGMKIPGHVANGVVVLEAGATLPEGMAVTVLANGVHIWRKPGKKQRVRFPLVRSQHPGTLDLNNERIAEILDAEDVANFQEFFLKPNDT